MIKRIVIGAMCLAWPTYISAQDCQPDFNQLANLKEQEKGSGYELGLYEPWNNQPVTKDENYQVFYVGFGEDGNGKTLKFFHNPKYVLLSSQTCEIVHVIDLEEGAGADFPENSIFLEPEKNKILISSYWLEFFEKDGSTSRTDIGAYDYHDFRLLYKRRFIKNSAPIPQNSGAFKNYFPIDKKHVYLKKYEKEKYGNTQLQNAYVFNIENGEFETKTVMDADYISRLGVTEYYGIELNKSLKESLGKTASWGDFKDIPAITLAGKEMVINYNLTGEPLFVTRKDEDETFFGSPEEFTKKFGIEIPPLEFVPVTEEQKGVLIAGEFLKQEKGRVAQTEPYAEVAKFESVEPYTVPEVAKSEKAKAEASKSVADVPKAKDQVYQASAGGISRNTLLLVVGGVAVLLLVGWYAIRRRRK